MGKNKKNKIYLSDNIELMKEWDWEKNTELNLFPQNIPCGSHKKAWWKCSKGHRWYSIISNRAREKNSRGCPYCTNQKVIVGENDLFSTCPTLAKEWNYKRNKEQKPDRFMSGSHKKVWWICKKGHEWLAQIKSRASGVGCPYCSGKKVLYGYNDLETKYPNIAREWHPFKNGELKPTEITHGSGKKIWWMCKYGHEWESTVCNRTKGKGCPICSSRRKTSFPEQAIFYYVKQAFPSARNRYKEMFDKSSMELDVFIPEINVGIEYDGKVFHSKEENRIRDAKKYEICKNKGVILIRITDKMQTEVIINCDNKITIPKVDDFCLNYAISKLLFKLNKKVDVDVARDKANILKFLTAFDGSLEEKYPELAEEWNYEKNSFMPNSIHPGSNEKVWWKCKECGHEWKTSPAERSGRDKTGCPICARKVGGQKRMRINLLKNGSAVEKGSFLLDEWDYDKNEISPDFISSTSTKKVWWKCKKCGYNWKTSIEHRIKRHSSCPCCRNQVVVPGINDLQTKNPILAREWDNERNLIKPTEITPGSGKVFYWVCSRCGNKWKATLASRNKGSGCPRCAMDKRKNKNFLNKNKEHL